MEKATPQFWCLLYEHHWCIIIVCETIRINFVWILNIFIVNISGDRFSSAAVEAFNWSSCPMMFCHIVSQKRKHPAIWKKLFEPETETFEPRSSKKPIPPANNNNNNNGILMSCLLNSKAQKVMPGISVAKRHVLGKYKHRMIVEILYTSVNYRKNAHHVSTIRIRQW